jgi:hypothetical protein
MVLSLRIEVFRIEAFLGKYLAAVGIRDGEGLLFALMPAHHQAL